MRRELTPMRLRPVTRSPMTPPPLKAIMNALAAEVLDSVRRPHVRLHGDPHADVGGEHAQADAGGEGDDDTWVPVVVAYGDCRQGAHDGDGPVLALDECLCALLDGVGDADHLGGALGLSKD